VARKLEYAQDTQYCEERKELASRGLMGSSWPRELLTSEECEDASEALCLADQALEVLVGEDERDVEGQDRDEVDYA
jgi:hypothetical protein